MEIKENDTELIKVMGELLNEIETTDPQLFGIHHALEPDDKILMTIKDESLRKLFMLVTYYMRETNRSRVDLECDPENTELKEAHSRADSKHDLLLEMFWYSCRVRYGIWGINIGLRKDWVLVVPKQLPDIIAKLFGGQ